MESFKFFCLFSSFIPPSSLPAPQENGMEHKIPHGDLLPSLNEDFYQDLTMWNFIFYKRNKSYLILSYKKVGEYIELAKK